MGKRSLSHYLVNFGFDLDAPDLIHRLRRVVAKIEKYLLELSRLTGYDGCLRHFADRQFNRRRQRGVKQRARLGYQPFHAHWSSWYIPAPAESEDLIDEITCSFSGAADLLEVAGRPAVGRELHFRHFGMTKDRPDDIVEVVCDTARESTDRLHTAGLFEIRLQARTFLHQVFPHYGIGNGVERGAQQAAFSILRYDTRSQRVEAENGYIAAARTQPLDACPAA
jgi:hypothetical protein